MTKRVLHIIPTLDRCGAEKQLTMLATGIDRSRFDVHVCALTRTGPLAAALEASEVPLEVIGKRWKLDPSAFFRLRAHVSRIRPDIVHTWLFAANAYGRAAAISAGVPRIVAGERCVDPWKSWYQLAIDRKLAKKTDAFVTNSVGVVEFYAARGISREKFHVIPNGVQPPTKSSVSREQILHSIGAPGSARLIGTIGRLWPQKGMRDVIWATDHLKVIRDDVHLLVIGDGPLRNNLEKYARQIEVDDHVHFLGERDDVSDLLPHLEVLVSGSFYEGMPNSVMEAMAAGVPVVATDIPGHRDLIADGVTGLLAQPGSVPDLGRLTNRLLDDPELAASIATTARDQMQTKFSAAAMISAHEELYDRLLG